MSLLLDALKKAAQENQNSSATDAMPEVGSVTLDLSEDFSFSDDEAKDEQPGQLYELVLDDDPVAYVGTDDEAALLDLDQRADITTEDHQITPTPSTVTDEALQLLIHKTNHSHKRSRLLVWSGIVVWIPISSITRQIITSCMAYGLSR